MPFAPNQSTAERGLHEENLQHMSDTQTTSKDSGLYMANRSPMTTEEEEFQFTRHHFDEYCVYPDDPSESRNKKSQPSGGQSEILAKVLSHSNLQLVRAFRDVRFRLLNHYSCRLALLNDRVRALDEQGGEHLRRLTKNQMRPAGHPQMPDDVYEVHLEEMAELSKKIHEIQCALESVDKLYSVPRSLFRDFFDWILSNKLLDQTRDESSAWVSYNSPLDMVSLRPQEWPWIIELSSLVVNSRIFQWFRPSHSRTDFVPSSILNFILRALFVISVAFLLLLPAGTLSLADLTRQQQFGVVSGCTIVFYIAASATKIDLGRILVVGIAYAAFLATVNDRGS
ncbi:hypothetical protein QBC35DRAFT_209487 [Podospora australis]|uniref:DUF6594 domain-containing protein n=1 Tax=Podospora australis TaxID=1536484 RepID=A0AAN6WV31_9PEZI|nr:hypothetical protein QBC35DRAFT_209487 [Podospora australis]